MRRVEFRLFLNNILYSLSEGKEGRKEGREKEGREEGVLLHHNQEQEMSEYYMENS